MIKRTNFVYLVLIIEGILMGMSLITTKYALDVLTPMESNACRWGIAAVVAGTLAALGILKVNFKGKKIWKVALVGLILPCVFSTFETMGISYLSAAESSILLAFTPVVVTAMAIAIYKKKEPFTVYGGIILAFVGVLMTVDYSAGFSLQGKTLGLLFLGGAVLFNAVYCIVSGEVGREFTSTEITVTMCIMGGIWFNGIIFFQGRGFSPYLRLLDAPASLISVLYIGLICSIVCYVMLNYALASAPAHIATMISINVITITGVITGAFFRGDKITLLMIIGMVLILLGVALVTLKPKEKSKTE